MYFYRNGMKFELADGDEEDKHLPSVTVIGSTEGTAKEYPILENAPKPFIYGVKKICLMFTGDNYWEWYNVITGEYGSDYNFPGEDWLYAIPTFVDTRPKSTRTADETTVTEIKLSKEEANE